MAGGETRGRGKSFEGLLFEGNTKDKSWTLVFQKHVAMTIRPPGGVAMGGAWGLVATQKDEPVWEGSIGSGLRHRVRDSFVQWQQKSSEGATTTVGLRLKSPELAQQFNSAMAEAVSSTGVRHTTKRPATDIVELLIVPPHGGPLPLTLHPNTTISQVMAVVAERHKLDPAHYNLALPAEDPKGEGVACFGSMTVSRLKTHRLYLRRQPGAPEEAWLNSGDKGIIQIELPRGERTSVKASGDTTLPELLQMVCRKRNMDVEDVRFDLPATEDSLADKTLGQLKLTFFKIIPRAENGVDKQPKLSDNQTPTDSPKVANRRHAPPPPSGPTQPPKVMKELSTEVTERLKGEGEGGEATPTNTKPDEKDKPTPPPVALKPKKRTEVGGGGREEVDGSGESPSIPRSALDNLVIGFKVREAAERPEMSTITEGLKLAAASGGRYLSVKRRRQQSMEEPAKSTQPVAPPSHRRSREMEDIDVRQFRPSPLAMRTTHSLRRRPRGPAPCPPSGMREHRAATLNRQSLQTVVREKKEADIGGRKPVRKAPMRPAPTKPEPKTSSRRPADKTTPPREGESPSPPQAKVGQKEEVQEEEKKQEEKRREESEEEVDFTGYEFHALPPPRVQSPGPQIPPKTPNNVVTATIVPQEGGGKTLIIKPSPGSTRRANIVFNLPPPPPPPEFSEVAPEANGTSVNGDTSTSDTSIAMATENISTNELSVVSNEYTNLDEEESEEEEAAGQLASVQEECEVSVSEDGGVREGEECGEREEENQGEKEGGKGENEGQKEGSEVGGSEENPESQENGVAVSEEEGEMVVLTLNEDISSLNCNGNNNIASYPPPPLEFVAPAEIFSTPSPQEGFVMPAEPSFDENSEESTDDEDDAVVLVAMTTRRDHFSRSVAEETDGAKEEEKTMREWDSTSSVKSLGTQLSVIDSLVESIQGMTEEMISETEIPLPPTPSPPPSPPVPIAGPPPPPPPVQSSAKKSPLPPKPAPPPTVSSVRKPNPTSPQPPGSPSVLRGNSGQQPRTQQTPSAGSLRTTHGSLRTTHSVISVSAAPRSPQLSTRSPANPPQSPRFTRTTREQQQEAVSSDMPPSTSHTPPINIWQQPQVVGPQSVPQSGNMAPGDMSLQLQLLQQQVLQQQMFQLQQQFQQLQHSIQAPAPMTMMPYPHPALVAMTRGGMPGIGQPVAMPTAGMIGGGFSPLNPRPPLTSTPTSQEKPRPPNDVIPEEKPRPPNYVIPEEKPRPPNDVIPEGKPRPQGDGNSQPESEGGSSDVTAHLRAGGLGPMEPQFDKLMEDVREVEQSNLLKKVHLELAGKEGDGSYSGMAAVLAEALKERRKHLTTTDKHNQTSISLDLDDSRLSEWDS